MSPTLSQCPSSLRRSTDAAARVIVEGQADCRLDVETDTDEHARRFGQLRRHGDFTLAYSTAFQPGISYFEAHGGYVAYVVKWGYVHVLGDPVVDANNLPRLLDDLLARFRRPAFYQISDRTAAHLNERRFYINEMGVDTRIDLDEFSFDGKSKEFLRYAANWLKRRGFRIEERAIDGPLRAELAQLDAGWKKTRRVKAEVRFLNRPLSLDDEPDVRRFFLMNAAGRVVALLFFDPLYSQGQVIGYATAFKRRDADATNGYAEPGIMKTAIEKFQQEGRSILRLGLSPLAQIEDQKFRRHWMLHHSFRYGFNAWWVNRYFYNLKGHAAFKQRFGGVEEKTFFATPSFSNDIRIAAMLRYSRII